MNAGQTCKVDFRDETRNKQIFSKFSPNFYPEPRIQPDFSDSVGASLQARKLPAGRSNHYKVLSASLAH